MNAAHRTAANLGLRLSYKGKVWAVALLGCAVVWSAVIWLVLHLLSA